MTEIGNHMWILLLHIHVYPFCCGGYFWAILILISKLRNQKLGISGAWGSNAISKLRKMMMNHDKPWLTTVFGVLSFFTMYLIDSIISNPLLRIVSQPSRMDNESSCWAKCVCFSLRGGQITSDVNLTIGLNSGGMMRGKIHVIFMDTIQHFYVQHFLWFCDQWLVIREGSVQLIRRWAYSESKVGESNMYINFWDWFGMCRFT